MLVVSMVVSMVVRNREDFMHMSTVHVDALAKIVVNPSANGAQAGSLALVTALHQWGVISSMTFMAASGACIYTA